MIENSLSFIPSIWTAACSWFTPTVFFILLNLVIGTIAITSNLSHRHQQSKQDLNQQNHLFRSPSVLHRLRSINIYKFYDPEPSPVVYHFDPSSVPDDSKTPDNLQTPPTGEEEEEEGEEGEEGEEAKSMDEIYSQLTSLNYTRTHPEPTSGESSTKLPTKIGKSESMKLSFDNFKKDDDTAAVESRRPATVRETRTRFFSEADEEVDAKADDFINRFKHELKLQRLDSILRQKQHQKR